MNKKKLALVILGYIGLLGFCFWLEVVWAVLAMTFILAVVFIGSSIKRELRLKRAARYKRLQVESRVAKLELKRRCAAQELIMMVDYYINNEFRKKQNTSPFAAIVLQEELDSVFNHWYLFNENLFPKIKDRIVVEGVRANEYLYRFPKEIETYRSSLPTVFKTRA